MTAGYYSRREIRKRTANLQHVILGGAQVAAGHFARRRDAEDAEKRGRNVAERAAGAQLHAIVFAKQNEWHGIRRVIGVWAAGDGIDHRLGVAVVGGDEPRSAAGFERLIDAAEAI